MYRPPEVDASIALQEFIISKMRDSDGDEPYLWVLAFKVDADSIKKNSLIPEMGVQVFPGGRLTRIAKVGQELKPSDTPVRIIPSLATFASVIRPHLVPIVNKWFDGLFGIVCLAWELDNFDHITQEKGQDAFEKEFGPALTAELNAVVSGDPDYDDALSRGPAGGVISTPEGQSVLEWRFHRLQDRWGRDNLIKKIVERIRPRIGGRISAAIKNEMAIDEFVDPDNIVGFDAAVFTVNELVRTGTRSIILRYTEEGADYTILGAATARPVHHPRLISTILSTTECPAATADVEVQVCSSGERRYTATAYHVLTTTRFQIANISPEARDPIQNIQWFLDSTRLSGKSGIVRAEFSSADSFASGPEQVLASLYPGGVGTIAYSINRQVLDLTNQDCKGVYSGRLHALLTYAGDPEIKGEEEMSLEQLTELRYHREYYFSIFSVELGMDEDYMRDLEACLSRNISDATQHRIVLDLDGLRGKPGDPPPNEGLIKQILNEKTPIIQQMVKVVTDLEDVRIVELRELGKFSPMRHVP
ncbi:hypothetical protein NWP13_05515 [Rhodococcus pyridinivorans]|nr:hypothetical protein [Rhodococcus pyridinivorans]